MLQPMPGLTLWPCALDEEQQCACVCFAREALERGRRGMLHGKSYVPKPEQWAESGQGRETVHFGALVKYNKVAPAAVEPLPPELIRILDQFERAGIFSPSERPDTCCLNHYEEGAWLPPHVDSTAFARPFFTLSLLSSQHTYFGEHIGGEAGRWLCDEGERSAVFVLEPGSLLRVDAPAAGPDCLHAVPRADAERISLVFRRLACETRARFAAIQKASEDAALARRERRLKAKLARGRVPKAAVLPVDDKALCHSGLVCDDARDAGAGVVHAHRASDDADALLNSHAL